MKQNIKHLPNFIQDDLVEVVKVICDLLAPYDQVIQGESNKDNLSDESGHAAVISKIILFGRTAKGQLPLKEVEASGGFDYNDAWLDDSPFSSEYTYDVLVVLKQAELIENIELWHDVEDQISISVDVPVHLIVHTLTDVNDSLATGQSFFADIMHEGAILYQSDKTLFALPRQLDAKEIKQIAQEDFEKGDQIAKDAYHQFQTVLEKGDFGKAMFYLHQMTQHLFYCASKVLASYQPNTHDLVQLRAFAIQQNEEFGRIFPSNSKFCRRHFQLLKRAYEEVGSEGQYRITSDELVWISERVLMLMQLTESLCQDRIDSLA